MDAAFVWEVVPHKGHKKWQMFKFFGILLGVAIRTKKPLDLHLAPIVWKQLAGLPLTLQDLEEVCIKSPVHCPK